MRLTGRVQHRVQVVPHTMRQDEQLLVLQVEVEFGPNHAERPVGLAWRDATAEDLAHLPQLYRCNGT